MPDIEWNSKFWPADVKRGDPDLPYYGAQWGDPKNEPHLAKILETFVTPFVNSDATILEIGPGGGRWTEFLLPARLLYCVDISDEMFGLLGQRFPNAKNMVFVKNSGTDFPGIEEDSIDFAFTFGTFVHLDKPIIRDYLENLRPLLKSTGTAVVQYSDKRKPLAAKNPCFSENTPADMSEMVDELGYKIMGSDEETLPHSSVIQIQRSPSNPCLDADVSARRRARSGAQLELADYIRRVRRFYFQILDIMKLISAGINKLKSDALKSWRDQ